MKIVFHGTNVGLGHRQHQVALAQGVRQPWVYKGHFGVLARPERVELLALLVVRHCERRAVQKVRLPIVCRDHERLGGAERDAKPLILGRLPRRIRICRRHLCLHRFFLLLGRTGVGRTDRGSSRGNIEHDLVPEAPIGIEREDDERVMSERDLKRASDARLFGFDHQLARRAHLLRVAVAREEGDRGALVQIERHVGMEAHLRVSTRVALDQRIVEARRQRRGLLDLTCQLLVHRLEALRRKAVLARGAHDGTAARAVRSDNHSALPALAAVLKSDGCQQLVEEVGVRRQHERAKLRTARRTALRSRALVQHWPGVVALVHAEEDRTVPRVVDGGVGDILFGVQAAELRHALLCWWLQLDQIRQPVAACGADLEQRPSVLVHRLAVGAADHVPHARRQQVRVEHRRPNLVCVQPIRRERHEESRLGEEGDAEL
mmetsp:Transcript_17115/g.37047  ORF Transcript_17115/g.37047 Transcript_17115/m.37047 type:complete len:434 (-) Transcript_17115:410-1711(-)